MNDRCRRQVKSLASLIAALLYLVINIRVEAGVATVFERAVDGLVGILVLLGAVFLALRFFGDEGKTGRRPPYCER